MKHIYATVVVLFISFQIFAQIPAGGKLPQGKSTPSIGHVYGKIVDSLGKPIDQASVILLQNKFDSTTKKKKDILFKGGTTNANGDFSFEDLPLFSSLKLQISAIGYKIITQPVIVLPGALDKDLGNIKLQSDVNQLQNVTVTTTASTMKMDIDKKTYDVTKDIVSSGGTAIDVMKNVPSVQVDIDGNVKVRNASPQIYVDGRPTTLSLDQIPADAIQSVEVITNPSAKYDASGGNAGILNIVLKKNRKTGYNGNLMAGVDSRGSFNGGGNFNVRQGKINFSAAFMANARRDRTAGTTTRTNFGDTLSKIYQNNLSKNNGVFEFGKIGLDYFVTNRTTLSLSGIKVHGEFKPNQITDYTTDSLFDYGTKSIYTQRNSNSERTFNANGLQFGMVYNFPKQGEQLTADGNYFSGKNDGSSIYTSNYYDSAGKYAGNGIQQQLASGDNKFFTIQTDYTNPLSKTTKLEAGLRAQINNMTNYNDTYYKDGTGILTKIPAATSDYKNTNNVYAAYATITSAIKNFGYEVGLRAESSSYEGDLLNTGQHFTNKYPISLFPSIFLSEKLGGKQELQANFSRRINRPNFFQLIPYTDYSDSLNITRGNPDLVPAFTNSFELSYSKSFKGNNSILTSLYYKRTNNFITNYVGNFYNATSGKTDLISTYENANYSYAYGAEFTSVNDVAKWWNLTTNINLYRSAINTDNLNEASQAPITSVFGKINNTFKLPANFSIQLSGNYQSKTNLPVNAGGQQWGPPSQAQSSSQGYIKPFWFADVAVKKTFLKSQAAAVTVSMSDIFRTRINEQIAESQYFYQDYYRLNNPQLVRINFSYRFGKMDVSLFKRTSKNSNEGLQDATQMGGGK